jgi:protein gp37
MFRPEVLDQIRRIRKPQRIFMPSMSDPFHPDVKDEWLDQIFNCIYDCKHLTFQILTKRPERMVDWITHSAFLTNAPLKNLWLGTSIENQQTANERCQWITQLTEIGYTTFVSLEPLLAPIDLMRAGVIKQWPHGTDGRGGQRYERLVTWAIVGGESGHNARPCSLDWIREIVQQCKDAGIAVYIKQLGTAWAKQSGNRMDSKGGNPEVWPADLRVREFPRSGDRQVLTSEGGHK